LLVNRQTVAIRDVDIAANSSAVAEFEWQAAYQPRLNVSIAVDPDGEIAQEGNLLRIAAMRNFSVEPTLPALARQGRSLVVVTNGDCGGFRFANGTQSFCGGSSDVELNPTISAAGQLVVQALSLNGGIVDLGPGPITGALEAPQGGYPSRAVLEGGHLYAVESNGKFALMYIGRILSDVDPRLARLPGGAAAQSPQMNSGSLPNLGADPLSAMLDRAKITVEMQWSYLENGSRRFQYGFSPSRSAQPGATVYRQPRAPSAPAQQ
jgi:hypothetical protein